MYKIKDNVSIKINQTEIEKAIGVTQPTLSRIINGKSTCRKIIAYCITKFIDNSAEIDDYFERVDE